MKFEHGIKPEKDCVAYISNHGKEYEYLVVKSISGAVVFHKKTGDIESGEWLPGEEAKHKLYPGDKITIEF